MESALLGFILEPLEDEYEGDLLIFDELPVHLILDLLLCDVPPIVISVAAFPLFLVISETLR